MKRALVLYDGDCALCRQSVALLQRLDWFGRVRYQDARAVEHLPVTEPPLEPARLLEEMHLLTPDRTTVHQGFAALRWLAWRLPLLWPLAPFLIIPGIPALGQRIYRWIARHRFDLVPCQDGVCQLPRTQ
ncbi:MAG: DUF393 domain-containing protein [Planctomycetia bacterium]|nr:DUF393 domain-containing protein [Planctomycetia bacterium]